MLNKSLELKRNMISNLIPSKAKFDFEPNLKLKLRLKLADVLMHSCILM